MSVSLLKSASWLPIIVKSVTADNVNAIDINCQNLVTENGVSLYGDVNIKGELSIGTAPNSYVLPTSRPTESQVLGAVDSSGTTGWISGGGSGGISGITNTDHNLSLSGTSVININMASTVDVSGLIADHLQVGTAYTLPYVSGISGECLTSQGNGSLCIWSAVGTGTVQNIISGDSNLTIDDPSGPEVNITLSDDITVTNIDTGSININGTDFPGTLGAESDVLTIVSGVMAWAPSSGGGGSITEITGDENVIITNGTGPNANVALNTIVSVDVSSNNINSVNLTLGGSTTYYSFPSTIGTISQVLGVTDENMLGFVENGTGSGISQIMNSDQNITVIDGSGPNCTLNLNSTISNIDISCNNLITGTLDISGLIYPDLNDIEASTAGYVLAINPFKSGYHFIANGGGGGGISEIITTDPNLNIEILAPSGPTVTINLQNTINVDVSSNNVVAQNLYADDISGNTCHVSSMIADNMTVGTLDYPSSIGLAGQVLGVDSELNLVFVNTTQSLSSNTLYANQGINSLQSCINASVGFVNNSIYVSTGGYTDPILDISQNSFLTINSPSTQCNFQNGISLNTNAASITLNNMTFGPCTNSYLQGLGGHIINNCVFDVSNVYIGKSTCTSPIILNGCTFDTSTVIQLDNTNTKSIVFDGCNMNFCSFSAGGVTPNVFLKNCQNIYDWGPLEIQPTGYNVSTNSFVQCSVINVGSNINTPNINGAPYVGQGINENIVYCNSILDVSNNIFKSSSGDVSGSYAIASYLTLPNNNKFDGVGNTTITCYTGTSDVSGNWEITGTGGDITLDNLIFNGNVDISGLLAGDITFNNCNFLSTGDGTLTLSNCLIAPIVTFNNCSFLNSYNITVAVSYNSINTTWNSCNFTDVGTATDSSSLSMKFNNCINMPISFKTSNNIIYPLFFEPINDYTTMQDTISALSAGQNIVCDTLTNQPSTSTTLVINQPNVSLKALVSGYNVQLQNTTIETSDGSYFTLDGFDFPEPLVSQVGGISFNGGTYIGSVINIQNCNFNYSTIVNNLTAANEYAVIFTNCTFQNLCSITFTTSYAPFLFVNCDFNLTNTSDGTTFTGINANNCDFVNCRNIPAGISPLPNSNVSNILNFDDTTSLLQIQKISIGNGLGTSGSYTFPTTIGSASQILQATASNTLIFADISGSVLTSDVSYNLTMQTTASDCSFNIIMEFSAINNTVTWTSKFADLDISGFKHNDGSNLPLVSTTSIDSQFYTSGRSKQIGVTSGGNANGGSLNHMLSYVWSIDGSGFIVIGYTNYSGLSGWSSGYYYPPSISFNSGGNMDSGDYSGYSVADCGGAYVLL